MINLHDSGGILTLEIAPTRVCSLTSTIEIRNPHICIYIFTQVLQILAEDSEDFQD